MIKHRKRMCVLVCAVLLAGIAAFLAGTVVSGYSVNTTDNSMSDASVVTQGKSLPKPEVAEGERGTLGIDKNVDETTIDQYINLDNVVYRDMRMLDDDANWEAIGGDSMLSGYVEGFEIVPYPYLASVGTLPEAVGKGYDGPTLFVDDGNGGYKPAFYESMDILEDLFPPDKDIVLMCGGGGYAGMTKNLLVSLGWDSDHIWNAGGWWYYEGNHGVNVARDNGHGQTTWDFHEVPTHIIDFDTLHAVGSEPENVDEGAAELVEGLSRVKSQDDLNTLVADTENVVLYVYLPGCSSCAEFAPIVGELAKSGEVPTYAIAYGDLSDVSLRKLIGHAPGVIVFSDGSPVASLSADKDEDMVAYHSLKDLTTWLSKAIGVSVIEGEATADIDCSEGCEP